MAEVIEKTKTQDPVRSARQLVARLASVQANAGPHVSDAVLQYLIGAEQALAAVLGKKSYLDNWLKGAKAKIHAAHATEGLQMARHGAPCGCGVCKVWPK